MNNKATNPMKMGDRGLIENCTGGNIWNYPDLWQYFQFHSVFSKDYIISLKKTVQIFTVVAECNPSPPTPHNTMHLDSSLQDRITSMHLNVFPFMFSTYMAVDHSVCRMFYPVWLVDNLSASLP